MRVKPDAGVGVGVVEPDAKTEGLGAGGWGA